MPINAGKIIEIEVREKSSDIGSIKINHGLQSLISDPSIFAEAISEAGGERGTKTRWRIADGLMFLRVVEIPKVKARYRMATVRAFIERNVGDGGNFTKHKVFRNHILIVGIQKEARKAIAIACQKSATTPWAVEAASLRLLQSCMSANGVYFIGAADEVTEWQISHKEMVSCSPLLEREDLDLHIRTTRSSLPNVPIYVVGIDDDGLDVNKTITAKTSASSRPMFNLAPSPLLTTEERQRKNRTIIAGLIVANMLLAGGGILVQGATAKLNSMASTNNQVATADIAKSQALLLPIVAGRALTKVAEAGYIPWINGSSVITRSSRALVILNTATPTPVPGGGTMWAISATAPSVSNLLAWENTISGAGWKNLTITGVDVSNSVLDYSASVEEPKGK